MTTLVLILIGAVILTLIVNDCVKFSQARKFGRSDAITCLGRLWNLMQAHDLKSVTLTDLTISAEGQITHCTVTVEHESSGKLCRVEAPYFADFEDMKAGGEPIARAIQRLKLKSDVMSSWRILVKVRP